MTMLDDARDALSQAAAQLEQARNPADAESRAGELRSLRGLISARWEIVDSFERDGKRYVVALRHAEDRDVRCELSPREWAVLAAAARGQHNKLIAFELGLAPSTVRVLMFRAMRKLRAKSRVEALERFESLAQAG